MPEALSLAKAAPIRQTFAPTSRGITWNGYVEARASANDPPAPGSNPANDTLSFTVDSASPQRQWVPNTSSTPPGPGTEANWNNDDWAVAGNISWHSATSGATQGQGKAKAGLNADGSVCVDARARVRDTLDQNLGNNGNDNSAYGYGKATMSPALVVISGPGPTVDATIETHAYMATPLYNGRGEAMYGYDNDSATLVVGTPIVLVWVDTAEARYPLLIANPGTVVAGTLYADSAPVHEGTVVMEEEPTGATIFYGTGAHADMAFTPWVGPGLQGQSHDDEAFYGAIYQTLTLPPGYEFQPVSAEEACYSNTIDPVVSYYSGHEGLLVGDDIQLAGAERELHEYEVGTYSAGTTPYDVTCELWTRDPVTFEPAAPIPGTACTFAGLPPGALNYSICNPGPGTILPDDLYMVCSFSDPLAGWLMAETAEVGFTDNYFVKGGPGAWLFYFFGDPPEPHAGFWAQIWCASPYPEHLIAITAVDWNDRLIEGQQGFGGIRPIEVLGVEEEEEIAELGMTPDQFRPARLYPVENLDGEGMDGLVMAFGDYPVAENEELVAGFDYHIGDLFPDGYGFYSGHDKQSRWCYRRLQFWNYWYWPWYYYPWYWPSKKLIVYYDIWGNRLLIDYYKRWRWWPWPYRYWWKYRVYPWYPWPWWWWRPYQSWKVYGPFFDPWRVVRIRYWETAWWYWRAPPDPWGGWWPWPFPPKGIDAGGTRLTPDVPWNAWGEMMIEAPAGPVPPCSDTISDADYDGDVDLGDFALFQQCFKNPDGLDERCTCLDVDSDGELDYTEDLNAFVANMTGPM
ncbi:MAG: hypothetical protein JSV19_06485 [Phycisphaerales bacterium]|nr:MAG: hypothetical protein JSV19_06485 [Phycisphaerales bacterium]